MVIITRKNYIILSTKFAYRTYLHLFAGMRYLPGSMLVCFDHCYFTPDLVFELVCNIAFIIWRSSGWSTISRCENCLCKTFYELSMYVVLLEWQLTINSSKSILVIYVRDYIYGIGNNISNVLFLLQNHYWCSFWCYGVVNVGVMVGYKSSPLWPPEVPEQPQVYVRHEVNLLGIRQQSILDDVN